MFDPPRCHLPNCLSWQFSELFAANASGSVNSEDCSRLFEPEAATSPVPVRNPYRPVRMLERDGEQVG